MATANADSLVSAVEQMALRLMDRCAQTFVRTAQANASRRTGEMADSVEVDDGPNLEGDTVTAHVTVGAEYGIYQDEGTGIYGPEGVPITPKSARVLAFDWPAAGGMVFAHSVRGSEPTRWWTKTVQSWPMIVRTVSNGG